MSSLSRIQRGIGAPRLRAAGPATDVSAWLDAFRQASTAAGVVVTTEKALGLPAVWDAVWLVADLIGSFPLITYERVRGGRRRADGDEVYRLLHDRPNPEMTAICCWSIVTAHMRAYGDAFLGKEFGPNGELAWLWPIRPDLVQVRREEGEKVFYVTPEMGGGGGPVRYTMGEIIHVIGPSLDGLRGVSPIEVGRETIGAGLAMQQFAHRFWSSSAIPRGILKTPKELSPNAQESLRAQWESKYRGSSKAHQVAVLEEGLEFQQVALSLEEAQFAELTQAFVAEVARLFRLPPSMLGASKGDSLTYSSVEMDSIHLLGHSVRPYMTRIEQALAGDRDLFPVGARQYPEFLPDALLQTDAKTKAEVYTMALNPQTGWLQRPEVRQRENLEPEDRPEIVRPAPPAAPSQPPAGANGHGSKREATAALARAV